MYSTTAVKFCSAVDIETVDSDKEPIKFWYKMWSTDWFSSPNKFSAGTFRLSKSRRLFEGKF